MAGVMDLFSGASTAPSSGLMSMYTNPNTAAILGLGQGLLQASAPSRLPVSMGQAIGMGMQGMGQGAANALVTQRQMMQMQALQGLMGAAQGGAAAQTAPASASTPMQPVMGAANAPGISGLSSGMQGLAPTPQDASASAASAYPAAAQPSGPLIMGRTPAQLFQQGLLSTYAGLPGGGDLMRIAVEHDPSLAAMMPTDITKMGMQGGMTPAEIQAANRGGVSKATYIAPVRAAPGGALAMPDGSMRYTLPAPQAGGMWATDQNGNLLRDGAGQPYQIGAGGASSIAGGMAAAQAGGKAQYQLQQVWDKNANNGQGGFVQQSVANVADAANGNQTQIPVGIRNNNFGNIKGQNGQFATYGSPQEGVDAADQLLSTYGAKHGINTIAGIASRWAPAGDGNNNPAQKAAAIAAASGVGVNQPIDLSDPGVRARILPALFDTETPGWRDAIGGGAARPGVPAGRGPMASQPPLGTTNAANASQGAPSKQMADSYGSLSNADAGYQQSREALTEMLHLAGNKGITGGAIGFLPEAVGTRVSPDAATYQKLHATYVALQGKALGSGGTDASRATIDEAVPTYDKPQSAMVSGLTTQLNNLDLAHIKTQFLTPIYQRGDEKGYTQQSAAFDQNIKPSMIPMLTMSGDAQRAAVQAAVKANPSLRSNFEWAFNNGLLK